jgi:hypothetical protein
MNLAEADRILRLSDSQLAIVRQAAVPLSPSARDRYPSHDHWMNSPSYSLMLARCRMASRSSRR